MGLRLGFMAIYSCLWFKVYGFRTSKGCQQVVDVASEVCVLNEELSFSIETLVNSTSRCTMHLLAGQTVQ